LLISTNSLIKHRNRLSVKMVKAEICTKVNYSMTCSEFKNFVAQRFLLINILSSKLFSCIKTFHNKNFRFQTQRVPPLIFFCPRMLRTKVGHRISTLEKALKYGWNISLVSQNFFEIDINLSIVYQILKF
jgi:hypothetical protein